MGEAARANLVLEDGSVFPGYYWGCPGEAAGAVIFHTGVVGYEGVLSDPAYRGCIVALTYPLVGNYGVNADDALSWAAHAAALVVRENSRIYSNWRASGSLDDYLRANGVVALAGVDTRALAVHLRERGEMRGAIGPADQDPAVLAQRARALAPLAERRLVEQVSAREPEEWRPAGGGPGEYRVVVVDLGARRDVLRQLTLAGWAVTLLPAGTPAREIVARGPDGVIVAGGPGEPAAIPEVVAVLRQLLGQIPLLGLGLGHLVLGAALGATVCRLRLGHHGANYAVCAPGGSPCALTVQNHSFALAREDLPDNLELTWVNMYDGTVEGIRSRRAPGIGVQFVPSVFVPGELHPVFREFARLMRGAA